jgi:hypothetical protein
MAFPSSPILGEIHSISGNSWTWNGFAWDKVGITGGASSLDDLSDVTLTSVTGGDILYYDSSVSKWINKSVNTLNIDGGLY